MKVRAPSRKHSRHGCCHSCSVPPRKLLVQFVVAVCAVTLGPGRPSVGQTVTASDVKAAFIFNFAKFTTWPSTAYDPGGATLCVMGDDAVAQALQRTPKGALEFPVRAIRPAESIAGCRVLYISGLDSVAASRVIDTLYRQPVLTVSDIASFAGLGGIAEIFDDSGRLRFAINVTAARRAGLLLSARMLSLARIVKDDRDVQR